MKTMTDGAGRERLALASLSTSMLLASLATSSVNTAVPTIAVAFGASFHVVQWVVLAFLLAVATTIVGLGRLGDAVGLRRLLELGLLVFGVASIGAALSPSLGLVIVARAAQGTGAAAMMAVSAALAAEVVSKARSGLSFGALGAMSATGTALGPVVGGAVSQWLDWRAIFALHAALAAVALVAARRFVPRAAPPSMARARGVDWRGSALLGGALAAYALGTTLVPPASGAGAILLLLSFALGALFVRAERSAKAPLLRLDDLRGGKGERLFASLVVSAVLMTSLVVGPFYLSKTLGLALGAAGAVLGLGPVVSALLGVPAGAIVDRAGADRASLLGLVGVGAGATMLALLPRGFGVVGFAGATVVMTASYALFQAANGSALLQGVERAQRGVISATLQLSRSVGLMTGATWMGAVFTTAAGAADVTLATADEVAAGARTAFATATVLVGVAVVVMTRRRGRGREGALASLGGG